MKLGDIRPSSATEEGIDIGPLIDIIFILLIFFMVSTTFVRQLEVPLERPSAKTATRADNRSIRVAISTNGSIFLDGKPVQPWMLQDRVRQLLQSQGKRPVLISADVRSETGRLIEVVDQCRLAGAQHVAVEAQKSR